MSANDFMGWALDVFFCVTSLLVPTLLRGNERNRSSLPVQLPRLTA